MKKNVYVNEGEIKRDSNVLKINGIKLPLSIVDNLFVFDRVKISISARNLLLKNSRAIYFMNYRYELLGMLLPNHYDSNYKKRLKQYENMHSLEYAKVIILKKIEAVEKFTGRDFQEYKENLQDANTLNKILGIEGIVSTYMFGEFRRELIKNGIKDFQKRTYRPVSDRINGLLSFLYTLYYSYVISEIISLGFDPYVSFLHRKRGKHAAFASDAMEEARVFLTFMGAEILKDVYKDGFDGLYLNKEARKFLLRRFDKFVCEYENGILKYFKEKLC
ncbi:CRISPR-associated endonuclease Cas1 [Nautilia sp.]